MSPPLPPPFFQLVREHPSCLPHPFFHRIQHSMPGQEDTGCGQTTGLMVKPIIQSNEGLKNMYFNIVFIAGAVAAAGQEGMAGPDTVGRWRQLQQLLLLLLLLDSF